MNKYTLELPLYAISIIQLVSGIVGYVLGYIFSQRAYRVGRKIDEEGVVRTSHGCCFKCGDFILDTETMHCSCDKEEITTIV
jgi:hypothetical protein